MGGITAQTVNAHTIHVHPPATAIDSAAMTAAQASRALAALGIFAPELARILAQQIHIFDRAIVNFICASAGNPPPTDHWTTFRPWKPNLYPGTAEFRELANEDAALLVEFYDSPNEIDDLVRGWRESETVWDVNVWNYLMQKVHHSVSAGVLAAECFCPGLGLAVARLLNRSMCAASADRMLAVLMVARSTRVPAAGMVALYWRDRSSALMCAVADQMTVSPPNQQSWR
jgi:hypothetical protein